MPRVDDVGVEIIREPVTPSQRIVYSVTLPNGQVVTNPESFPPEEGRPKGEGFTWFPFPDV